MPLRVFVVFHDRLEESCYAQLSPLEFEMLTFVAVRPDLPKRYNRARFTNVVNEWELPIYDPSLQARGYKEASVLWHLRHNNMYAPDDVVLLLQWDMVLQGNMLAHVLAGFTDAMPMCNVLVPYARLKLSVPEEAVAAVQRMLDKEIGHVHSEEELAACQYPLNQLYAVRGAALTRLLDWTMSPAMLAYIDKVSADETLWVGKPAYANLECNARAALVVEHAMGMAIGMTFKTRLGGGTAWIPLWHPASHALQNVPADMRELCAPVWAMRDDPALAPSGM